jgi:hypothetical protein
MRLLATPRINCTGQRSAWNRQLLEVDEAGARGRAYRMSSGRMGKSSDFQDERVRRFEGGGVHELIHEGHSLFDYRGLLERAAPRAGMDLQEVHPTLQ